MKFGDRSVKGWEITAAGYTGVWATENTREALWDAMKRKETYSTSGPRMIVRFFGGFEFEAKDAQSSSPAEVGYAKGVPMGGDLKGAPQGKAPTFLVAALARSNRRQPRPHPDHQGLGRQERTNAGEDL